MVCNDQFFTKKPIALECHKRIAQTLSDHNINTHGALWVEPSCGSCHFLELLPKECRVGIEIDASVIPEAFKTEVIIDDFLKWQTPYERWICIGNPPFGKKGAKALAFFAHAREALAIGFIVPQSFCSIGKSQAMNRIKSHRLVLSERLQPNSFQKPDGSEVSVHCMFQVWLRNDIAPVREITNRQTCNEYITLYTISNFDRKFGRRNTHMIGKCDLYLASSVFSETNMKCVLTFEELHGGRGIGIRIHRDHEAIKALLMSTSWHEIAVRATNNSLNLRADLIEKVIIAAGYVDHAQLSLL